jgi:putative drug exporter of the RND superfamily
VFEGLGRFAYRRRWWVLACWVLVLAAGVTLGGQLFDRLTSVDSMRPDVESQRGERQVKALVDDGPIIFAVVRTDGDLFAPDLVHSVADVALRVKAIPGVVDVDSLYTGPGGRVGNDQHSTLVWVQLAENLSTDDQEALEDRVRAELKTIHASSVLVGGDTLAQRAFGDQAVKDLAVGESIAFALLLIALVVIFGGFLAASIPVVVALTGVSATLLALYGISLVTKVGEYSVNIVTLLGIGLAVDYALLIVARFREERGNGVDLEQATATATARAGRAVALSGLAVVATFASLALFAEPLLASMALGGTAVAALTTALALTAVPALLGVLGRRIKPARPRPETKPGLLARLAGYAQRNPGAVATASTVGLLLLAAPLTVGAFGNSDARALPTSLEERRAYDVYEKQFAVGQAVPVTIVAQVSSGSPALRTYLNTLTQRPEVHKLDLRRDVPSGWVIADLTPKGDTAGGPSRDLVRAIRAMSPPFPTLVTGPAADVVDTQGSILSRLPFLVLAIIVVTFVVLYLLTGSFVIPLKALVLNALTYLATLGALIAIFQWGWGQSVLRFDSWGALDLTTPLLLFVFVFGLSMDYEVFLLARITEEYRLRPDNDRAVLAGIARSGRVVTAAAACITIVFLGFAAGGLVAVKEIGVGMSIAIVLDVTVVRGLLLPAAMTLLGRLNWWSPIRTKPSIVGN